MPAFVISKTLIASLTLGLMFGAGVFYGASNNYYFARQSNNSTTTATTTASTGFQTTSLTSSSSASGSFTSSSSSSSSYTSSSSSSSSGRTTTTGTYATTTNGDNTNAPIVTSPYCGRAFKPFCNGGCNYWSENSVSGGVDLILNFTISDTFSSTPCFTAGTDLSSTPEDIFCRINPTDNYVCFMSSGARAYPECFRPKELVEYTFYFYSSSAYAQPYQVILAKGTCDNQQIETEEERSAYVNLCDDQEMTQPVDSTSAQTLTFSRYQCGSSTSCNSDATNTYTVNLGETHHIAIVNDDAFGVRFTGKQVCFSWKQTTESYYPYGLDPTYTSTCMQECVSASRFQFSVVYNLYNDYAYGGGTTKYTFVLVGGTDGGGSVSGGGSGGVTDGGNSTVSAATSAVTAIGLSSLLALLSVAFIA